jgi:hypothetical protein
VQVGWLYGSGSGSGDQTASGSSGISTMQQPLIGGAAQRERSLTVGHPRKPSPLGRHTERGSWSGPAFASRAGPADGFGPQSRKEIFIFS